MSELEFLPENGHGPSGEGGNGSPRSGRLRALFPLRTVVTIVSGAVMLAATYMSLSGKVDAIEADRKRDREEFARQLDEMRQSQRDGLESVRTTQRDNLIEIRKQLTRIEDRLDGFLMRVNMPAPR